MYHFRFDDLRIIRILRRVTITQCLRNISQLSMLPTNQDILSRLLALVMVYEICNTIRIIKITRCVYGKTKIVCKWLDSLKRPSTLATCMISIFLFQFYDWERFFGITWFSFSFFL
jgi:hypothetical protein